MQDQFNLARPAQKGFDAVVGPNEMFSTLGQALSAAKDGWSILITDRTREAGKVTCTASNLTIKGTSRGQAFIDVNQAVFTLSGDNVSIDNVSMNMDGNGQLAISGAGAVLTNISMTYGLNTLDRPNAHAIYLTGHRAKVSNFDYKQNTAFASGASSYAILRFEYGDFPTLVNSTFDSGDKGFNTNGMVYIQGTRKGTVANCNFYSTFGGTQVNLNAGSFTVITNCVFENGGSGASYAISTNSSTNVEISNCIIKNSVRGISVGNNSTVTGNYIQTVDFGYCIYDIGTYSTITGNIFTTVSGGTSANAIRMAATLTNTVIANNVFSNIGGGLNGNYGGYIFKNNTFDTVVNPVGTPQILAEVDNSLGAYDSQNRIMRYFKNTSGGSLAVGDAVILKSVAANNEITTTTTAGDSKIWGIVATSSIANNAAGYVITSGTTNAKVNGTTDIAIGDFLSAFTAAGILQKASAGQTAIAIALAAYTTDDSSGVISVRVISPRLI